MKELIGQLITWTANQTGALWIALMIFGVGDALFSLITEKMNEKVRSKEAKMRPHIVKIEETYKDDPQKKKEEIQKLYKDFNYKGTVAKTLYWISFVLSFFIFISVTGNREMYQQNVSNLSFFTIEDITSRGFSTLSIIYLVISLANSVLTEMIKTEMAHLKHFLELSQKAKIEEDRKNLRTLNEVSWEEMLMDPFTDSTTVFSKGQVAQAKRDTFKYFFNKMISYVLITMISFLVSKTVVIIFIGRSLVNFSQKIGKYIDIKRRNGRMKKRTKTEKVELNQEQV